jgi:hypothetical protein
MLELKVRKTLKTSPGHMVMGELVNVVMSYDRRLS